HVTAPFRFAPSTQYRAARGCPSRPFIVKRSDVRSRWGSRVGTVLSIRWTSLTCLRCAESNRVSMSHSLTEPSTLAPRWFFVGVMLVTAVPIGMSVAGRFGWLNAAPNTIPSPELDAAIRSLHGLFIHTVLQWTGVCLALMTALCAIAHYALRRHLATSIVGAALLFGGCMDAFQTLAATRIVGSVLDDVQFV